MESQHYRPGTLLSGKGRDPITRQEVTMYPGNIENLFFLLEEKRTSNGGQLGRV